MIPVLLDDRCEPRLPGSMVLMSESKVLLNLVPDLRYPLVPLNLRLRERGIDLILSHDTVIHAIELEKLTIGLAAVSLVGIDFFR